MRRFKNDAVTLNSRFMLRLRGSLKSEVGPEPRIKVTESLTGTVAPGFESGLCKPVQVLITQNGTKVCSLSSRPIEISYLALLPY